MVDVVVEVVLVVVVEVVVDVLVEVVLVVEVVLDVVVLDGVADVVVVGPDVVVVSSSRRLSRGDACALREPQRPLRGVWSSLSA